MATTDPVGDWAERFAPQLALDPTSALDRLLVAHLGDCLESIDAARLVPAVSAGTRRDYEGFILNFERWCLHEGFTDVLGTAAVMPGSVLRLAVEEWLMWRATPIGDDHPLSRPAASRCGDRNANGWREPSAMSRLGNLRAALRWWARCNGLAEVVSARADLISGPDVPVRPSRALTDAEIVAVCELLCSDEVFCCVDVERQRAWNAHQFAVFTVTMTVSLRRSELQMLTDANVIGVGDDGLTFRFPRTKLNPRGRIIKLRPRDDILCPVRALTRWLAICDDRHWDRGGLLLPGVHPRHVKALGTTDHSHADRVWRMVTDHLGITDDVRTGLRSTPHGLRAIAPTRAAESGWDPFEIMRLGNWTSLDSALRYDRGTTAPDRLTDAVAADLASHATSTDPL